jgi:hypothetical protein
MFLAMENQFFILLLFQKHDFYFYVFLLFLSNIKYNIS